jgi:hypothetical protein
MMEKTLVEDAKNANLSSPSSNSSSSAATVGQSKLRYSSSIHYFLSWSLPLFTLTLVASYPTLLSLSTPHSPTLPTPLI